MMYVIPIFYMIVLLSFVLQFEKYVNDKKTNKVVVIFVFFWAIIGVLSEGIKALNVIF